MFTICERTNEDAVRSLILDGLQEHWGSVDPTLNPDLDDLAATYAAGRVLVADRRGPWLAPAP